MVFRDDKRKKLSAKGHEGGSGDAGKVLHFDCKSDYTPRYIFKASFTFLKSLIYYSLKTGGFYFMQILPQ